VDTGSGIALLEGTATSGLAPLGGLLFRCLVLCGSVWILEQLVQPLCHILASFQAPQKGAEIG
jgi:hypothetical protein